MRWRGKTTRLAGRRKVRPLKGKPCKNKDSKCSGSAVGAGCQSGTTQRLAHHLVCSIGLDADGVSVGLKFSQPPLAILRKPTRATSCLRGVSSWRLSHETKRAMIDENKQWLFGVGDVVTAGCCLFVFLQAHLPCSGGDDRRERRMLRHHQPDMTGDVIARHGKVREDAHPEEQSQTSCQPALILHRPKICQLRPTVALTCD